MLLFSTVMAIGVSITKRTYTAAGKLLWMGQLILATAFVINYNHFTLVLLWVNGFLLLAMAAGSFKSIGKAATYTFHAIGQAFLQSYRKVQVTKTGSGRLVKPRTILIPFIIILAFLLLYRTGSEGFKQITGDWVDVLVTFFHDFNLITLLGLSLLGILFSSLVWVDRVWFEPTPPATLSKEDEVDSLKSRQLGLEGCITFGVLNTMIAAVLYFEVMDVWLGFEWNHQLLKKFVHSGTYVLLASTAISLFTTLFYYGKRYPKNGLTTTMRVLSSLWCVLNMVLLASLLYRTSLYIQYFGLAYLRIGVIYFVVAATIGIITVLVAIHTFKTRYTLVRTNSVIIYCLLVSTSFICWDQVIPIYNLKHADQSFVDLKFFTTLSHKSLYVTNIPEATLDTLNKLQRSHLNFVDSSYHKTIRYTEKINTKKEVFLESYEGRHWLEWNYPEWKTYVYLTEPEE